MAFRDGPEALPAGRVSITLVRAPDTPCAEQVALLSPGEKARMAARRGVERQARFACAHALLRCRLAPILQTTPESVCFAAGAFGRPRLATADRSPAIDFNLSSTPGWVACAFGTGVRVGVDVQAPDSAVDTDALGRRLFTDAENSWRKGQPGDSGFYQLWTLKEAVAKAHGEGLGLPFQALETLPLDDGSLRLELSAIGERAKDWTLLALCSPAAAALAVRHGRERRRSTAPLSIVLERSAPGPFQALPLTVTAAHAPAF